MGVSMNQVYIASSPDDLEFVQKLSKDLSVAGITHWYDAGDMDDATRFTQLQNSTHLVAVLSPSIITHEPMLAALEFASQNKLEKVAVRLAAIDEIPPQLRGVLPVNFSDENDYDESLATLIDDLNIEPSQPTLQLPEDIREDIKSLEAAERQRGIENMAKIRDADMRQVALEELNSLIFRERDPKLRALIRTVSQKLNIEEGDTLPKSMLPSKEELAALAAAAPKSEPKPEPAPPATTATTQPTPKRYIYFWQTNRWHPVWLTIGIVIGIIGAALSGFWGYLVPPALIALILPPLNIEMRKEGDLEWPMANSTVGNTVLALVIAGLAALVLAALYDGETTMASFMLSHLIVGGILGAVIGVVSAMRIEV